MAQKKAPKKGFGKLVRLSPFLLLGAVLMISTSGYAFGNVGGAGYGGVAQQTTGQFMVRDGGFHVVGTSGSPSQCAWRDGGTCASRLVRGDWYYEATLILNKPVDTTRNFTVTVSWDQGGGLSVMGSIGFTVPAGSFPGQTMHIKFDTGSNTLGNQLAVEAVVA